jgi:AraC-like DNA-binding protein
MVALQNHDVRRDDARLRWPAITGALFGGYEIDIGDASRFRGAISHARLGSVDISRVVSAREFARRTARHIAVDGKDKLILVNVLRGNVLLRQAGRDCSISAGKYVLYDSGRPTEWLHDEETEVRNLAIPRPPLRGRLRALDRAMYSVHPCASGLWRVVDDFLASLEANIASVPNDAADEIGGQIVDLVGLALEAEDRSFPIDNADIRAAIHRRCVHMMRRHVADPGLTPATIAAAVGVSVRTLHRIFQCCDDSFGERLLNARLDATRAALEDPGKRHLSIGEVAYRAGFRSQAIFANTFKRRYGRTAGEWRDAAARGAAPS